MQRRRALALLLTLLLASCGRRETPAASSTPPPPPETVSLDTLRVELPRGVDADAARSAMASLPERMAERGVEIGEVTLTFGASSSATVQALSDGGVDLAFLPAKDFIALDREESGGKTVLHAIPILGDAAGNSALGTASELCAGPSAYGRTLAGLDRSPTWAELDHARWGILDRDSLAGFGCLELWLEDRYGGNGVADLSSAATYDGWQELLEAAAEEEIDCFPLPVGWEEEYASLWTLSKDRVEDGRRGLGRDGAIREEIGTLGVAEALVSYVGAVSPKNEVLAAEVFRTALAAALNASFDGPAEELSALGAARYAPITPADLDPLRRCFFS